MYNFKSSQTKNLRLETFLLPKIRSMYIMRMYFLLLSIKILLFNQSSK